ncbi:MAG: aldehyde dehydrogenase family protein [Chthoniobacteraceae bacterium]
MHAPAEPPPNHAAARIAQSAWCRKSLAQRVEFVRRLRPLIAEHAEELAAAAAAVSERPLAEKLVSEVLPLADACRWLEENATRVLAPKRHGKRGRPFWLQGATFEVQRKPFGVMLVIGPGNYPLFLPAVQALQALVAGNAVLLKPAPGTRAVALAFARLVEKSGLDADLLTILPETVDAVHSAIADGVDKVVFTGSSENGRNLGALLAETNTPSVMELSGEDAVVVMADADLDLVVRALRFGTRLNAGATCIAPRRLVAADSIANELARRLQDADVPALPLQSFHDSAGAIDAVNASEYGLGASIFSRDVDAAAEIARQLRTGFVLIDDLIVPTADPRLPFGGVKASGHGTTRGEEGLLEMTFPHVVGIRRGRMYAHFDEADDGDARLFAAYIRAAHGKTRFSSIRNLFSALRAKTKRRNTAQ